MCSNGTGGSSVRPQSGPGGAKKRFLTEGPPRPVAETGRCASWNNPSGQSTHERVQPTAHRTPPGSVAETCTLPKKKRHITRGPKAAQAGTKEALCRCQSTSGRQYHAGTRRAPELGEQDRTHHISRAYKEYRLAGGLRKAGYQKTPPEGGRYLQRYDSVHGLTHVRLSSRGQPVGRLQTYHAHALG